MIVRPYSGKAADTSGKCTIEHARALKSAGIGAVFRIVDLPARSAANDLSRDELEMWLSEGFHVGVYAFFRRSGHSYATGAQDAGRAIEKTAALGLPPESVLFIDLECDSAPNEDAAWAYVEAWRDLAMGDRVLGVYLDNTFASGGCDLGMTVSWWWQSGNRSRHWNPPKYHVIQHPQQVTFSGMPFDLDDVDGLPMSSALTDSDWEEMKASLLASQADLYAKSEPDREILEPPE